MESLPSFWELNGPLFVKYLCFLHTWTKFGWNWSCGSRGEHFIKFCYLLLENVVTLHLNEIESPSPKQALCQVCWNWPNGSRGGDFINFLHELYFCYSVFLDYLPFEKGSAWPFIWTNLNSLSQRMPCAN